jgi:hypothetical protein
MSFLGEAQRRKVFVVAVIYLIGAWLTLQIADVVVPALLLPQWVVSLVLYLLILAFPLVPGLAWHFDLTAEGLKPDVRSTGRGLSGMKAGVALSLMFTVIGAAGIYLYGHLAARSGNELSNVLSRIPGLRVIAHTSSFQFSPSPDYDEVGRISRALGVANVVTGKTRRNGSSVRITANLIDAASRCDVVI